MNNYIIKLKQILQIFLNYFDYSLKSDHTSVSIRAFIIFWHTFLERKNSEKNERRKISNY